MKQNKLCTKDINQLHLSQDFFETSSILCFQETIQIEQRLKEPHNHLDLGIAADFQCMHRTERVGFEPTRVLPLHDFESCAINRTLPPLHTPLGVPAV